MVTDGDHPRQVDERLVDVVNVAPLEVDSRIIPRSDSIRVEVIASRYYPGGLVRVRPVGHCCGHSVLAIQQQFAPVAHYDHSQFVSRWTCMDSNSVP